VLLQNPQLGMTQCVMSNWKHRKIGVELASATFVIDVLRMSDPR
jgi:hypothetical protein